MLGDIVAFLCGFLGSYFKSKNKSYTYAFFFSFILYFIITAIAFSFFIVNSDRSLNFFIVFCLLLSLFLSTGVVVNMKYSSKK